MPLTTMKSATDILSSTRNTTKPEIRPTSRIRLFIPIQSFILMIESNNVDRKNMNASSLYTLDELIKETPVKYGHWKEKQAKSGRNLSITELMKGNYRDIFDMEYPSQKAKRKASVVNRGRGTGTRSLQIEKNYRSPAIRILWAKITEKLAKGPGYVLKEKLAEPASAKVLLITGAVMAVFSILFFTVPAVWEFAGYHYHMNNFSFGTDATVTGAMYGFVFPPSDRISGQANTSSLIIPKVEYKNYVVKSGDSISGITYKSGLKRYDTLLSVNNIPNATKLQVGTKLLVPNMDGIIHNVAKGESLDSIAKKYGIGVNSILDANDLDSENINAGTRLFIPGGTMSLMEYRKAMGELFIYPVIGRFTSGFGYRADPFTGARQFHNGIDIAAPKNTPIKAALDGKVAVTGQSRVYGNYIIVTHGNSGYQTMYGHMNSFSVKQGQVVSQGQEIGKVGTTGYSTGYHLHLSVYKNGVVIDPFNVLDRKLLK